jgi:hypothetical protein
MSEIPAGDEKSLTFFTVYCILSLTGVSYKLIISARMQQAIGKPSAHSFAESSGIFVEPVI